MLDLKYNLVIEATEAPDFFGFYSPDLEGFSGVGNSIEDCISKAIAGMEEHLALARELGLSIPPRPRQSKIVIQNEARTLQTA